MEPTRKKILIIDDDEKHLVTTQELLENEGYNVFIHNLGFGATNIIKNLQPDLVLLDVNMPGLSGTKLASILKSNEITKEIPLLLYSSNDENSLREAVLKLGIRGYICKGDIFNLREQVSFHLSHT
jgi:two-component system OmpR family response regulator